MEDTFMKDLAKRAVTNTSPFTTTPQRIQAYNFCSLVNECKNFCTVLGFTKITSKLFSLNAYTDLPAYRDMPQSKQSAILRCIDKMQDFAAGLINTCNEFPSQIAINAGTYLLAWYIRHLNHTIHNQFKLFAMTAIKLIATDITWVQPKNLNILEIEQLSTVNPAEVNYASTNILYPSSDDTRRSMLRLGMHIKHIKQENKMIKGDNEDHIIKKEEVTIKEIETIAYGMIKNILQKQISADLTIPTELQLNINENTDVIVAASKIYLDKIIDKEQKDAPNFEKYMLSTREHLINDLRALSKCMMDHAISIAMMKNNVDASYGLIKFDDILLKQQKVHESCPVDIDWDKWTKSLLRNLIAELIIRAMSILRYVSDKKVVLSLKKLIPDNDPEGMKDVLEGTIDDIINLCSAMKCPNASNNDCSKFLVAEILMLHCIRMSILVDNPVFCNKLLSPLASNKFNLLVIEEDMEIYANFLALNNRLSVNVAAAYNSEENKQGFYATRSNHLLYRLVSEIPATSNVSCLKSSWTMWAAKHDELLMKESCLHSSAILVAQMTRQAMLSQLRYIILENLTYLLAFYERSFNKLVGLFNEMWIDSISWKHPSECKIPANLDEFIQELKNYNTNKK